MGDLSAPIRLSKEHKGRPRREPVWIGRYRIVGKDSARVLGKAWTKPIRRLTREGIADFRAGLTDRDLAASTHSTRRARSSAESSPSRSSATTSRTTHR